MSVSVEGLIAKSDGDSDWVSKIDCDLFERRYKEIGCVVVGRRTFEQFQGSLYPMKGVLNIVLTSQKDMVSESDDVYFVNSVKEGIELAKEKGYNRLLIAGGGRTNAAFLKADLIDEVYLSVHPLSLGKGIGLFEGSQAEYSFNLLDTRPLGEGLVELHYSRK